ncbi:hypothetical protein C0J52_04759 [Blattella germanica]|nr:hypothetical protein C0J52_04759 [Blattella germanica]
MEWGSVADKTRTGRQAAKLAEVRNIMECSHSKSFRRHSAESQISYGSSQSEMKQLHSRAYGQIVQELKKPDKQNHVAYCTCSRSLIDNHGIADLDRMFFTYGAWFHLSGYINSENA